MLFQIADSQAAPAYSVHIGVAHLSGVLIMFMLNIVHSFPSWTGMGS